MPRSLPTFPRCPAFPVPMACLLANGLTGTRRRAPNLSSIAEVHLYDMVAASQLGYAAGDLRVLLRLRVVGEGDAEVFGMRPEQVALVASLDDGAGMEH